VPRVEQWATERNLKEHHLKTIYGVVMKAATSTVQDSVRSQKEKEEELSDRLKRADVPHKYADALGQEFRLTTSRIIQEQLSASGGTKLVIELASGNVVETVLIRHERRDAVEETVRYTVCVSSQVGCAKACSFCATGTMGLLAHLSSAEILEQVWLALL